MRDQEAKNKIMEAYPELRKTLEGITLEELTTLWELMDWLVKDNGGNVEKAIGLLSEALAFEDGEIIDAENLSVILKGIKEALDEGEEMDIVFPNVLGFLYTFQDDYKRKLEDWGR